MAASADVGILSFSSSKYFRLSPNEHSADIMALLTFNTLIAGAGIVSVFCYAALIIYRLYFHPLAKFPGSKLAASSLWYEFYYNVILRGKFMWKLQEMHERYGESPNKHSFNTRAPL